MFGFALGIASLLSTGAAASWLAGASMVVGIYTAREQRKKAERAARNSIQDRNVMLREAITDRPHVFGRVRLSGQVQFPGVSGQYSEKLHFCLALGDRFDAIEEVWFGDKKLGTLAGDGWATEEPFARTRSEPGARLLTIASDATVTLPHTAHVVDSVALPVTGDGDPGYLTQNQSNNPPDHQNEFYVTGDNPTKLRFHTSRIGQQVTVSYRHFHTQTFARAKPYLGVPGQQADAYLVSEIPDWTATDRFTATTYLAGTWVYDPDIYPTGIEEVMAVARAELCYDPRTATEAWTRNPALIASKWIKKNHPNETVNETMLIAAANVCDESVEYLPGQFHARYTYDGVIPSTTALKPGLEDIVQAMVGSAARVAGQWYIWAGAWEEPTMDLDIDDLAPGEIVTNGAAEDGVSFNGISGSYLDPETWAMDSFPAYVSPAYVAADGGEEEVLDIELKQITDWHRVQRVRNLLLHKARQSLTFACTLEMSAYGLHAGMMVTWTLARYGWEEKPFRCLHRKYNPATSTITAVFQEDAEAIYESDYSELTGKDPAPNTNLPDPRFVATPVATFASGSQFATVLADGTVRPYLRMYWQPLDESAERIEVRWRRADQTTWQSEIVNAKDLSYDIYGVSRNEQYIVQVRAVNGIGVRSTWAIEVVAVAADAPINGASFVIGIGTNQQINASFRTSTEGWRYYTSLVGSALETGSNFTTSGQHSFGWAAPGKGFEAYRPAGVNGLVIVDNRDYTIRDESPSTDKLLYYLNGLMAVEPGDRIELQCRVATLMRNTGASLRVQWFDKNDAPIGYSTLSDGTPEFGYADTAFNRYTLITPEPRGIKDFKLLYGFATAPVNAASAQWVLMPFCLPYVSAPAGSSILRVAMPWIGKARASQQEPSIWSPGPGSQ